MRFQRQRRIAAMVAVAAGGTFVCSVTGCGPAHLAARRLPAPGTQPPTLASPTRATSAKPVSATPGTTTATTPVAVASTHLTVTRAGRRFDARVLYPSIRNGSAGAPISAGRPFPLIVFSPGFDVDPAAYDALVEGWVLRGLVVAVPDYPFTAPGASGGINEADIVQHPADLEATIDTLLTASSSSGTVLSGLIDPWRVGLAGHSDGGDVTDALVSDSCCRDPRIRAAAVLSGAELDSFGGAYGPARVPLLVTQGDSDTINLPACSEQIYATGGSPRYYLDLRRAGHLPPYTPDPSGKVYQQAVDRVTGLFWAAYLEGDRSGAAALQVGAGLGPTATLFAGQPVGEPGSCPGAP